jgi:hypothetical protein
MAKYYITNNPQLFWIETNARTLRGAKKTASKIYHKSINNKIQIATREDCNNGLKYITVAIKCYCEKWLDLD